MAKPRREARVPLRQWGRDLEPESIRQIENACRLPVAVQGALMTATAVVVIHGTDTLSETGELLAERIF